MTPGLYFAGPLAFDVTDYEGGVPNTYYYPYSWSRVSIFPPSLSFYFLSLN